MAELKLEEAKKELKGMVNKAKEAAMSPADKIKAGEAKAAEEVKAKRDADILNASEEDLKDPKKFTDEERASRPELIEKQRKEKEIADANLSAEERIKRIQKSSQDRIDELTNKLKLMEDKSSKEAEVLRKELDVLKKEKETGPKKEDVSVLLKKEETERIAKYAEEDKDKPREEKREMSDEEWDDWNLESPGVAQDWRQERNLRRRGEMNKSHREKQIKTLFDKQHESCLKTYAKHPELDTSKREKELLAEGKSKEEIGNILLKENEKFRIAGEILKEHPDWIAYEDCPERIITEMEKRLASPGVSGNKTIEELTAKIEELSADLARLSSGDEGVNSTIPAHTKKIVASAAEKVLISTMREMNATQPMIDSVVKKLREGASA